MKIIIIKKGNGIHDYLSLTIEDAKKEDQGEVIDFIDLVDKWNKFYVEHA